VLTLASRHGLTCLVLAGAIGSAAGEPSSRPVENSSRVDTRTFAAWQTLRQMDCARCHGADWEGSVGPSILAYVRSQSKESFVRAVLEGNPGKGMPGYRGARRVVDEIDAIYDYFRGVAAGEIPAGKLEVRD
jgi:mono/diheme cytochrome c family protein